jgi:hypothetical protein
VPTWCCRAKSPEGEFLRQAGIEKQWVTSSGYMSCVSASGKMLGYAPSAKVLEEFRKLPESERGPGAVKVADLDTPDRLIPPPPEGGMVLKVHARFLSREDNGQLRHARPADFPLFQNAASRNLFLEPNTEYMWLTAEEWKSLLPAKLVKGEKLVVPGQIGERMARFHLTPRRAMTSEGGILSKADVKSAKLELTVEDVTPARVLLRLEGFVHSGTVFDKEKATTPNGPLGFGFESPLHGLLEYDIGKKAFVRFDVVAAGEVWGRWGDANGKSLFVERPGSTPFGFAFELASGDSPTERIPPGGNPAYIGPRSGYFGDAR